MTIDLDTHCNPTGFPIDHPMDALKKDHDLVTQLFDRYLESEAPSLQKPQRRL